MQQAPLDRILKWSLNVRFFLKYFISKRRLRLVGNKKDRDTTETNSYSIYFQPYGQK